MRHWTTRCSTLIVCALGSVWLSSCARMHHVKIGNIDNTVRGTKFEIKMNDLGINLERSGRALGAVSKDDNFKKISDIAGLFQMGPKTGNPIYNLNEFSDLNVRLKQKCPSMKITGLTSIREMRNYDVVSGEIVKITGYCNT